ncbi:hypothetical protein [Pengzhenrongella frigida]|uniref:Uncharacterized protein n=1 Tax=Pengzhenrongella frigida TaxID=1259133 RepID=A0A4V1ZGR5_9MICO|nr:hypothetical protein [Cellulomonas sp. HLT2-17]RYV49464.1 hypothetical protein EUA98_18610 [Cellulomonas sp. HLT2-17]
MSQSENLLSAAEIVALREAIAAAVLSAPAGMSAGLQDDPVAYLRLVAATRTAAEETSRLLREAVDGARHAGHSWDTIGRLLGVSRQAAQQRFGAPGSFPDGVPAVEGVPERKILSPLTAFDEMDALAEAGRHGWHSVDYGTLFHLVEASPWQWEHRRDLVSIGGRRHRLRDEGWQLIKTMWFPWAYYKRRLDLPAEPE